MTNYEFKYCVCVIAGLVSEQQLNHVKAAGFNTLSRAVDYADYLRSIHGSCLNNIYVFEDYKPVYLITCDGSICEY